MFTTRKKTSQAYGLLCGLLLSSWVYAQNPVQLENVDHFTPQQKKYVESVGHNMLTAMKMQRKAHDDMGHVTTAIDALKQELDNLLAPVTPTIMFLADDVEADSTANTPAANNSHVLTRLKASTTVQAFKEQAKNTIDSTHEKPSRLKRLLSFVGINQSTPSVPPDQVRANHMLSKVSQQLDAIMAENDSDKALSQLKALRQSLDRKTVRLGRVDPMRTEPLQ